MKYNAEDILLQTFELKFRGYDPGQVREFLDALSRDWENLSREVAHLTDRVEEQAAELALHRQRERALHDTLELANRMAQEVKSASLEEADRIETDARSRADRILEAAEAAAAAEYTRLEDIREQRAKLESDARELIEQFRTLLDADTADGGLDGADARTSQVVEH